LSEAGPETVTQIQSTYQALNSIDLTFDKADRHGRRSIDSAQDESKLVSPSSIAKVAIFNEGPFRFWRTLHYRQQNLRFQSQWILMNWWKSH